LGRKTAIGAFDLVGGIWIAKARKLGLATIGKNVVKGLSSGKCLNCSCWQLNGASILWGIVVGGSTSRHGVGEWKRHLTLAGLIDAVNTIESDDFIVTDTQKIVTRGGQTTIGTLDRRVQVRITEAWELSCRAAPRDKVLTERVASPECNTTKKAGFLSQDHVGQK
jgi:hypothetical protein